MNRENLRSHLSIEEALPRRAAIRTLQKRIDVLVKYRIGMIQMAWPAGAKAYFDAI